MTLFDRGSVRFPLVLTLGLVAAAAVAWFIGDVPNRYRAGSELRAGRVALLASDLPTALQHFRTAAGLRPSDEAIVQQYDQTQQRWVQMVEQQLTRPDPTAAFKILRALPPTEGLLVEPHRGQYQTRALAVEAAARELATAQAAAAREAASTEDFDGALAILQRIEPLRTLLPDYDVRVREVKEARLAHLLDEIQALANNDDFAGARTKLQEIAATLGDSRLHEEQKNLDETEARAALKNAQAALERNDLAEAKARLTRAAELKVVESEVAAAQANFLSTARNVLAGELVENLLAAKRAAVTATLEKGHAWVDWPVISADALLSPTDLPAFLTALEQVGLGPKAMETFIDRLDVPLVLVASRQLPRADTETFLRDSFASWSRFARDKKLPGLALFLDSEAQRHGAKLDEKWRKETLAEAATSTHVTIAVSDPVRNPKSPAGLDDGAVAALRKALRAKLTSWPALVDHDPKHPATVVFSGEFAGFDTDDDSSDITTKSVRYQSGTRRVPNAEAQEVYDEYRDLLDRRNHVVDTVNEKQRFVDEVRANSNADDFTRSRARDAAIEIASSKYLVSQWDRKLDELRARGKSMPTQLSEPVYDNESYSVVHHVYTCTLRWQITAALHADPVAFHQVEADTKFRTDEVSGNAAHGVPVRAPEAVPEEKLKRQLVPALISKVGKIDEWIDSLPELTFASFSNFHGSRKTDLYKAYDQYLALLFAWEQAGWKIKFRENVVDQARQAFHLTTSASGK